LDWHEWAGLKRFEENQGQQLLLSLSTFRLFPDHQMSTRPVCGTISSPVNRRGTEWSRLQQLCRARRRPRARLVIWCALIIMEMILGLASAGAVQIRWAISSNRIYVTGPGAATLSQIKEAQPQAPLKQVSVGVWHLKANLIVGYLGYDDSEGYGLTWKVIGEQPGLFDKVDVLGDIQNSRIHHNFFGVYTFGGRGMQWLNNEVDNNVQYGFDPHDDTDHLLIQGNNVHHNGNHGIIASMRCDHLTIRNNRSWANGQNGIILHRSSDDCLIEQNQCYDNADTGIVLAGSSRCVVRSNLLARNFEAAVRLNLGSADNLNWTGYGTHILNAQCKVTQIPSTKKTFIGQIYFKAGNYCQDNAGTTNEGAVVSFYQLSVEHSRE
jgi:parallel beta-helix repeat protein